MSDLVGTQIVGFLTHRLIYIPVIQILVDGVFLFTSDCGDGTSCEHVVPVEIRRRLVQDLFVISCLQVDLLPSENPPTEGLCEWVVGQNTFEACRVNCRGQTVSEVHSKGSTGFFTLIS